MNIIGINAFHGDSAACLFIDGQLQVAAEEERFRRIKHWAGFPSEAIQFCLESSGLALNDIDIIAINTDKRAARKQKIQFLMTGQASWSLIREKMVIRKQRTSLEEFLEKSIPGAAFSGTIEHIEHHECHLASAFYASPFDESIVLSVDGFGDFSSAAWAIGSADQLDVQNRVYFPHSLGIFYQALTQFLGFHHYGDEYKIMGLAPYGSNRYAKAMDEILLHKSAGLFALDTQYFTHHRQPVAYQWDDGAPQVSTLFSAALTQLLGPARQADEPLEQRHKDLAHSVQNAYERAFFHLLNHAQRTTGLTSVSVAGGCGMNSVANGKIYSSTACKKSYIQAAAGDAGGAIGAAMLAGQRHGLNPRSPMAHAYWGPSFNRHQIDSIVMSNKDTFIGNNCQINTTNKDDELYPEVIACLQEGGVVGWFQGAMEWGPRALGNRSILGDPRRTDMKDILNLKIKRRESFRPFAPAILREHVSDWFDMDDDVPFMMKVFPVKEDKRSLIPAVTHADGSGRLQTVTEAGNPRYYRLIKHFHEATEVPILLNTSFNENEPVVCQPQEAIDCFLRTDMDMLVLEHVVIRRGN